MSLINRSGTFKFLPIDWGISETSGGYPQFQMSLIAKEYWDQDEKVWIDWSQYEENEIIAYLVLVGGEGKPLLNCQQIQKALGWSGESFSELANGDYSQTMIQGRVEEQTYQDNTRLKIVWIDHVDAEPGRTVQKLDVDDVKKLDAKYAVALKNLSGGKKPKKPAEKPKVPGKKSVDKTSQAETKPPKKQSQTEEIKNKPPEQKVMGKQEAWEAVLAATENTNVKDKQLNETWLKTIADLGGEENFEPGDWKRVSDIVIEQLGDDIPFNG